ncbi:MAG: hypothetical protein WC816_10005 [Sphingomonas sp.]
MRRSIVPLLLLAPVASCVSSPPVSAPVVVPRTAPVPAPAPPPTPPVLVGDWPDWPLTPGTWTYRQDSRGSVALFGVAGADAEVTLRCDRKADMVYLSRRGAIAGNSSMVVRTTALVRTLAARPTGGAPSFMAVALAPGDAVLDAMGYSRGRFVIEQAGLPVLVVPAWAEILRVTEDCRS